MAAVVACALAAAGTTLVLYLNEQTTNAGLHEQLDQRQRSLTDANQKLSAANVRIDRLDAQADSLNSQISSLTASNNGLTACVAAVKTLFVTLNTDPGSPDLMQLARTVDTTCGF
ncbi:hypothetical protein [Kutzneria sp. NPDC052558]|uniref:hypothetical protein n=1 Tax=Kutzneria sp. NPDC052558 TaxID=3364121 RepID=UPI0037C50AF2